MIDFDTYRARKELTGSTDNALAERLTVASGEKFKIRGFDIPNYFRAAAGATDRTRFMGDMIDRFTSHDIEAVREREASRIRSILKASGVEVQDLEVHLLHRAWGKRDLVFVNGKYYGVYHPASNRWTHREG